MSTMTRDALRLSVIDNLLNVYPTAQKVAGGVAFRSDVMDEETGLFFPVEIKVSVRNTFATARSKAYDVDKAAAEFAAKPGRRVADPEKKAQREADKAKANARRQAGLGILRDWVAENDVQSLTASDIYNAIPDLQNVTNLMNTGILLKELVAEHILDVTLGDKRKKCYTKI